MNGLVQFIRMKFYFDFYNTIYRRYTTIYIFIHCSNMTTARSTPENDSLPAHFQEAVDLRYKGAETHWLELVAYSKNSLLIVLKPRIASFDINVA